MTSPQNSSALTTVQGTSGVIEIQSANLPNVLQLIPGDARGRAVQAANAVNIEDTLAILDFGLGAQEQIGAIATKLLEGVRGNDMEGTPITVELERLNKAWQAINPRTLAAPAKGLQLFGGLNAKIQAWAKGYEEVNDSMAKVEQQINLYKTTARKDIGELDELFREADQLSAYAKEGEAACLYLLSRLQRKYIEDQQNLDPNDENAVFNLQILGDVIAQIDARRFSAYASRGEVVVTKSRIRTLQQMNVKVYGEYTTKLLHAIPKMKMDLALMHKMIVLERATTFLQEFAALEEKRSKHIDQRLQQDARTISAQTNNATSTMERILQAYESHGKLLADLRQSEEQGYKARREAETMIGQVQQSFLKKVGDFTPGEKLQVSSEALAAASQS